MKAPYHPCPDDEVLQEVAAGLAAQELAEQTWQHASRCSICGPALKRYMREFSDEPRPENARILEQLKSSTPEWQRRLVREVATRKRSRWPKLIPVFAGFAAVLVVAALLGPQYILSFKLNQAKKDVAAAFAERRTNEPRLTATDYSDYKPFPTILGPERSVDELPSSLHNALSAAIENLKKPNADPRWLQIQGRAFLWEATPTSLEKAEKNFEKARAQGLNTPDLEIDLAAAYYARDNSSDHPNLQRTLDLLNKVLTEPKLSDQDRATALFNLALAYERTQAWDLAVETWEKYLQVDSLSAWAKEARDKLEKAKAKTARPRSTTSADPAIFLKDADEAKLNGRLEEYLDIALTSWLPDSLGNQDPSSWAAVRSLSETLASRHHDFWLADLVRSLRPSDLPAVKALAKAIEQNGRGDHAGAIDHARDAAKLFAKNKSPAGEYRAELEEVGGMRRSFDGPGCFARAEPLVRKLAATRYYWLHAQAAVEKAECGNLVGAFAEADGSLDVSRQIASRLEFTGVILREIGMLAGNQHLRGNCNESWQDAVNGLQIYWERKFSSRDRLYQFYSVMFQCALEEGALYVGEAFLREALYLRENSPEIKKNSRIEGALHWQLANALLARGANQEAKQEKQKAKELLGSSPPKPVQQILALQLAEFQLRRQDLRGALESLAALVPENGDSFFSLRYYKTLGEARFQSGQLEEAAVSYHRAINTAESALGKIKNWNERLQWLRATDESYRGLVRVQLQQGKTDEALDSWETYSSKPLVGARLYAEMPAPHPATASTTSSELLARDKSPRIVYAEFNDGLQIWISWKGEIRGRWVKIEKADVTNPTRQFIELCATENSKLSEVQELGAKLYSIFLQPIAADLPPSGDLTVELDPRAYNLPIEALRTPEGKYFAENYAVVYSPGIWMEQELRSPISITGRESLLLLDGAVGYLPGFASQKNTITQRFPKAQIIRSATTDWSITRSRLSVVQLIHIMTHGRQDSSGTSLDYDSHRSLRAYDFTPNSLSKAELVVLAACSSAAGREYGIADTSNLVHAFLAAGVPIVVASHWNVDAGFTSQLMSNFYVYLTNDESALRAMYNARIDMLRANPHPYFWAGFGVSGRAI